MLCDNVCLRPNKVRVVFHIVYTTDISEHDVGQGDAGVNGCNDVDVVPSNASSHLNQLLNLQRNPQVSHTAVSFSFFSFSVKF